MSTALLLFLLGLVGLWLGSDWVTRAALQISKRLGLSPLFVGLTILAIGADFPEIIVSFTGAIKQLNGEPMSDLVAGNIIGSNMAQMSLILGLSGLFKVLKINRREALKNGLMLIASTFLVILLAMDGLISRADGLVMVMAYLIYFLSLQRQTSWSVFSGHLKRRFTKASWLPWIQMVAGLAVVVGSSNLVLDKGLIMARALNINQMLIGVIFIGLGTSLPELVVSINALIKGESSLSVGNLIGCDLVDILVAFGGSAMVGGWQVSRQMATFDLAYLLFTVVVVVLFLLTRGKLERKESILLISLYGVYLSLKLLGF